MRSGSSGRSARTGSVSDVHPGRKIECSYACRTATARSSGCAFLTTKATAPADRAALIWAPLSEIHSTITLMSGTPLANVAEPGESARGRVKGRDLRDHQIGLEPLNQLGAFGERCSSACDLDRNAMQHLLDCLQPERMLVDEDSSLRRTRASVLWHVTHPNSHLRSPAEACKALPRHGYASEAVAGPRPDRSRIVRCGQGRGDEGALVTRLARLKIPLPRDFGLG